MVRRKQQPGALKCALRQETKNLRPHLKIRICKILSQSNSRHNSSYAKRVVTKSLLALGWALAFTLISVLTPFNIWARIDGLWLTPAGEDLARNLAGTLAYHNKTPDGQIITLYTAPFYAQGVDTPQQTKQLNNTIDLGSWRKIGADTLTTTYADQQFKYVVYQDSNGVYMRIFNL